MHMGDGLISPAVGGTMLVVAAGAAVYSIRKVKDMDESRLPLMGVMSAFVFSAQMINFTIPGTGSSGHLGGGLILAALLGPYAGYLSMAAILLIQALFFGDGGLLAYGCNLVNMGFFSCFVAYPFVYKFVTMRGSSQKRLITGSIAAGIIGLQFGAFGVVLETLISGKTLLPFSQFAWTMQGIHLAIGTVEGIVTAAVVSFVWKVRPDILNNNIETANRKKGYRSVIVGFLITTLLLGGIISLIASNNPDGLEWSIGKVAGVEELNGDTKVHEALAEAQQKTTILPDYSFKKSGTNEGNDSQITGTSVSGIVGSAVTLGIIVFIGYLINVLKRKKLKRQTEQ